MYLSRTCFASQFSTTRLLLIRSARLPSAKNLAEFHPSIARSWITAASNKLLQPQHVMPNSRKLAWWRCLYCEHQYSKRVDLHVAAGGICPKCNRIPRLASDQEKHAGDSEMLRNKLVIAMKHRCRPDNSLSVLEAPNANRVKSSIADDDYLRVSETRNLLPMLARSYDKEVDKISDRDELYVSPKLDGVRCVVAWNVRSNGLSFFSRSGTLFECCDHIERQLKPLFKRDNTLVLDGELYIHKAADFEQLMSTVRTMRCNRTPEIEKLQKKLQYHVFDILYAKKLPNMSAVPFAQRYEHLLHLMQRLKASKQRCHRKSVKLVPVVLSKKSEVNRLLRQSVERGYEGVMIRLSRPADHNSASSHSINGSGVTLKGSLQGSKGPPPGYAYGARSPNLLKYKRMKDEEYIIVDGVEGKGKWRGCLGAFVCKTGNGHRFTVAPATTEERRREMWKRIKTFKGKMLTVQYQELSTNGVPRFPIGKCVRGQKGGADWV